MNGSRKRALQIACAIAAFSVAGCGESGSRPADKGAGQPARSTAVAASLGIGSAIVTTNDVTGTRPRKGALDRLADGAPTGTAPGQIGRDGLVAGAPDTGILDRLPQPAGLGAAKKVCAAGSAAPSIRNVARIARSILCLLNAERVARRLKPLRHNRKLARAAVGHSRDMVTRGYFAHNGADGDPVSRIKRAGYIPRAGVWTIGENLAYGTGAAASPAQIVAAWMRSPGHKANILTRGFKEIGIGIVPRAPIGGGGAGATFTTTFGGIRRR
jgi:uncharacterized protein YkwD